MARPTASYRVLELGGSAAVVGIVAAAYSALSAVAAVPIGRWIDRFGTRVFLVTGSASCVVAAVMSAYAPGIISLAIGQSLFGLGQIAAAIGLQALTAARYADDRDQGFARLTIAASTGQLLGPFAAGILLEVRATGTLLPSVTTLAFVTAAGAAFLGLLLMNLTPVEPPSEPAERSARAALPLRGIVAGNGMPQALATSVAILTAIDLLIAYLPVLGESRGISPTVVGVLLSLRAGAGLVSRLAMGPMLRRLGRRGLLLVALAGASAAMLGIAAPAPLWLLALACAIVGFGLGVGSPVTMAWVADRAPGEGRGTALALRMTGNRVGQAIVPAALGFVATALGPAAIFVTLAGTLAASCVWVRTSNLMPD